MIDQAFPREFVPWKEYTLTLARPTLKAQAAFKEELEREALAGIRRKRDMLSAAEYAEAIRAVARDFTARVYAWGGPEWARCIQDVEWYKRMLWHVLLQQVLPEKESLNPFVTPDLMDQVWEDLNYPADEKAGTPAGNLLDEAYARLMAPDPNPTAPPQANGTPAAAAPK